MLMSRVQCEIESFRRMGELPRLGKTNCKQVCDDVIRLEPSQLDLNLPPAKDCGLTIMAATHGNEVGGIAVLNQFLEMLEHNIVSIPFPVTVALGNPAASLADRRFLERDLNRSFMRSSLDSLEDRRARALEPILQKSAFFLDIHQTIEPSANPFLIFPYQQASFEFARQIAPDIPIVTHWGASFSKDGACTDEFVNRQGGVGVTIELGQKGFSSYQESVGLRAILRALLAVDRRFRGQGWNESAEKPEIYTWAEVIPYPEGEAHLDKGWYNFRSVEEGQRLGLANGQEILAGVAGPILFPKYLSSPNEPKPKEICRIMKLVSIDQLGKAETLQGPVCF